MLPVDMTSISITIRLFVFLVSNFSTLVKQDGSLFGFKLQEEQRETFMSRCGPL